MKSPSQIHRLPFSCETLPKVEADLAGRGVGGSLDLGEGWISQ